MTTEFYTPAETAQVLRVSLRTVRTLLAKGDIPSVRVGGSVRIPKDWFSHLSGGLTQMNDETVQNAEEVSQMLYAMGYPNCARIIRNAIDVRTFKIADLEHELKVLTDKPIVRCVRCNGTATRKMVPDNIRLPEGNPGCELCEACIQHHVWQAEEVNEHEMRNFGGAWGLVTYHFEPL